LLAHSRARRSFRCYEVPRNNGYADAIPRSNQLNRPLAEQIDGATLCEESNKAIDPVIARRASLTAIFAETSRHLHERSGSPLDFEKARNLIVNHFSLKSDLANTVQGEP
jgi:hypothetical protein